MNDAELQALTAIVQAETVEIETANADRARSGFALAYREDLIRPNVGRLKEALMARGVKVD